MWVQVVDYLPMVVVAIVVVIIGSILASSLKSLIEKTFRRFGIDNALNVAGGEELSRRAGVSLSAGNVVGTIVKWFTILVFMIVALDVLRFDVVKLFVNDVVIGYLPRVIAAVLILMVAVIVSNAVKKVVVASTQLAGMTRPELFGKLVYGAIMTVAVLAALNQLKIASELIQPLFTGIVFAVSLALGLAFGLGGKEAAARVIDSIAKK